MITAIVSIIIFGLLIGVHEAGHLIAAKCNHVKVHEFAIGMGPKIFSFQGKETVYSLRLIPIGGYCAMEGENEESADERAFCNRPAWARLIILASGALMNLLLGFLVFLCFFIPNQNFATTQVEQVIRSSSAYEQGLQEQDVIVQLNHTKIHSYYDIMLFKARSDGSPIDITVLRDGKKVVVPAVKPYFEGGELMIGYVHKIVPNSFYQTVSNAFHFTFFAGKLVLITLWDLLTGYVPITETAGPVGIVTEIGKAAKIGLSNILYIFGMITVNLGLFNLLPIPALDGGRIFFVLLEMIFRRKIPAKVEASIHAAGMLLLLSFMLFVTFHDISKLFAGFGIGGL